MENKQKNEINNHKNHETSFLTTINKHNVPNIKELWQHLNQIEAPFKIALTGLVIATCLELKARIKPSLKARKPMTFPNLPTKPLALMSLYGLYDIHKQHKIVYGGDARR